MEEAPVSEWFCYMALCGDGTLYVGSATDPEARVRRHNSGAGSKHTKLRRPVRLVWKEWFATRKEASARERELKGWRRDKKLALIEKCAAENE